MKKTILYCFALLLIACSKNSPGEDHEKNAPKDTRIVGTWNFKQNTAVTAKIYTEDGRFVKSTTITTPYYESLTFKSDGTGSSTQIKSMGSNDILKDKSDFKFKTADNQTYILYADFGDPRQFSPKDTLIIEYNPDDYNIVITATKFRHYTENGVDYKYTFVHKMAKEK